MPFRTGLTLGLVSLLFFLVTAETFSSLGVVLPAMVADLHWSWGQAGIGFSLLGVFCGITSTVPAMLIRRIGVRATLAAGGAVMVAACAALALTQSVWLYFLGCGLAGLGFTLLGTVPGTYLLARGFTRPDLAFGLYFTIGGLGGVAGPPLYFLVQSVSGGWRDFWIVSGALALAAALLAALLVDTGTDFAAAGEADPDITRESWTAAAALRTPQFAILAASYSIFLLVGITVSAVSVAHLMHHGVSPLVAGGLMSLEAFINAGARLLGGVLSRLIDARRLLLLSLLALMLGLGALSVAGGPLVLVLYAAGIGIGYGLTFFAATILLLDYFGRGPNLELFAIVNLISTVGSVGPTFAGLVFDRTASFVPAFAALAVLVLAVLGAVAWMKPPRREAAAAPVAA